MNAQTGSANRAAPNADIESLYAARTPGSARLAADAATLFPSGVTHDSRYLPPHGIYVERAEGAHKWDVDGNVYVDYFGGHGALLLGHNHPEVTASVHAALERGTHFAAGHELEIRWGRAVQRLVPSAERVRFVASGTEATLMALRLARAYTERRKVVRFRGHFHGWHDHMTSGYTSHFDGSPTAGVLPAVAEEVILLDAGDRVQLHEAFADPSDIAAVVVEPTGPAFGMLPVEPEFLEELRTVTTDASALLVFDEVVTGFRVSPGGAQARFGVTPDLTPLAKILAGGLPGGALAGRRDVMDLLDFGVTAARGLERVQHPGTFNANPLSAAAGTATLEIVERGEAGATADATAARLRAALNEVLEAERVPWAVYGRFSGFNIFFNPDGRRFAPEAFEPGTCTVDELAHKPADLVRKLRLAMLAHGVDLAPWPGGHVSSVHGDAEITVTAEAFRESLRLLRREGLV